MGTGPSACLASTVCGSAPGTADAHSRQDGPELDHALTDEAILNDGITQRAGAKKGAKQRIGNKSGEDGAMCEDHLPLHRKPRSKATDTRNMLRCGMKQDRVCQILEEDAIKTIIEEMEYFEFKANETVVKQGETGNTFFVTHTGTLQVSINGKVVNTLSRGGAFGGLALLYNCPRTATVTATEPSGVWGANGETFKKILQENSQKHSAEYRQFLDTMRVFDGLQPRQKDSVTEHVRVEVFEKDARVITEGESPTALYLVKKGELVVLSGITVHKDGKHTGGKEVSRLKVGDVIGEGGLTSNIAQQESVVAAGQCELLCIRLDKLKEVLGNDLASYLEHSFILSGMRKSSVISTFSAAQQYTIVQAMQTKSYKANASVDDGAQFCIVLEGDVSGILNKAPVTFARGQWFEETAGFQVHEDQVGATKSMGGDVGYKDLKAGSQGAKLAMLTKDGLARALNTLGLSTIGGSGQAEDHTRKLLVVKKVPCFRHLSQMQTEQLVKSFRVQHYTKGEKVFSQGEVGNAFFVIAKGEVHVLIKEEFKRTMGKNATFGERALLFDEPRTATIEVSSSEADLWSVDKAIFNQIVKGKMQQEMMHRIRLQDTSVTLKDLKHIRVVGAGAAGVVRLVEHKKTGTRYALKRVKKVGGQVPAEVERECDLLGQNDHPFIMAMVKIMQTSKSIYMLTELITGGELHAAIRKIPTVLSRSQAQFYTGSLVLVLEELSDRNILYRDLKPENVMLDHQGYLKLIDFGIAKKLEEGKTRTFTMIGTPHYMAPEVMRGHGYGAEVDVWSLGVMLFEFVCGCLPFADDLEDPTEVCTAVLKDKLVFPSRFRDPLASSLIQGLLCRQPRKRLGAGVTGFGEIKGADFFRLASDPKQDVFVRIMGRELDPPVMPAREEYCDPEDVEELTLSDADELG